MAELLVVLGVSLSVSFLCSILEAVFLSVTHSHVALMKEAGERAGYLLSAMRENVDEPIAAILTLNTIAHTVGASVGGAMAYNVFGEEWIALFSAVLTFVILMFSEIVPKTVGATYWPTLAKPAAYTLRAMIVGMKPILVPLSMLSRLISPRGEKRPTVSRAELEILAEIGRREGTLDMDEWEVVSNVINLDQVRVSEAMTPRTDVSAIPVTASPAQAKAAMVESGHSRLPVYDGSLDDVVGVLISRDLQRAEMEGIGDVRDIMRPVRFAPGSKSVEDLLREMRRERIKLAVVIDEFGGTSGIVTLEDLIEEIVGDIQDEHEHEPQNFVPMGTRTWSVGGWVTLRDLEDRFGLDLPEERFDTMSGFIFGLLGRIGEVGDEVESHGARFRIESMDGLRVDRAVLVLPDPEEADGSE